MPKLKKKDIVLGLIKRGDLTASAIADQAKCSITFVYKIKNVNNLELPKPPQKDGSAKKNKQTSEDIEAVRSLLKTRQIKAILEGFPKLRDASICVLYETSSLAIVQDYLLASGIELSRERIRVIVGDHVTRSGKVRCRPRRNFDPTEILRLFDEGVTHANIMATTGNTQYTVSKVLREGDRSIHERNIANKCYAVGNIVHNWEVIAYNDPRSWLCRDIRNGIERVVPTQNLRLGTSTGSVEGRSHGKPVKPTGASDRQLLREKVASVKPLILEMYECGVKLSAIARSVGVSRSTCDRLTREGAANSN